MTSSTPPADATPSPTVDDFWATIESAWALEAHLSTLPLAHLRAWDEHFQDALDSFYPGFDHEDMGIHAAALGAGSDDSFLYARCFVVGCGRKFYELFKANPMKYRLGFIMGGEDMLYVAMNVAEKKWGSYDALHKGAPEEWKEVGGEKEANEAKTEDEDKGEGGAKDEEMSAVAGASQ